MEVHMMGNRRTCLPDVLSSVRVQLAHVLDTALTRSLCVHISPSPSPVDRSTACCDMAHSSVLAVAHDRDLFGTEK